MAGQKKESNMLLDNTKEFERIVGLHLENWVE